MKTTNWINLVQEKLEIWWVSAIKMLPNLLLAMLVLFFFLVLARSLRKLSARIILRLSKSASISGLLSGVLYSIVIVSGITSALDILGLDKTVSSLLAGVGIIGLALGFAFQDLTANFISGAFIAFKRPFDVGHTIETNGFQGTIEEIQLRSTTLRTSGGLHIMIPNKEIFQKPIINYSRTEARKVEIEFVLPNSVDATFTSGILHHALASVVEKYGVPGIEIFYTSIENPNMKLLVSFWTANVEPREFFRVRHEAIMAIYSTLRDHGIYQVNIDGLTNPKNQKG